MSGPRITGAACKTPDGRVWAVPAPGRHNHVFKLMADGGAEHPYHEIQGFVTEDGDFLTRAEAEALARRTGQLMGPIIGGELTSEDLW